MSFGPTPADTIIVFVEKIDARIPTISYACQQKNWFWAGQPRAAQDSPWRAQRRKNMDVYNRACVLKTVYHLSNRLEPYSKEYSSLSAISTNARADNEGSRTEQ